MAGHLEINLSPSIAQKLLNEGPLSAWANHRRLGNLAGPPSDTQLRGRIYHAAILDDTSDLVIVEADSFRTKDARDLRDKALAEGKTPVIASKWEAAKKAGWHIREELAAREVHIDGKVEHRMKWTEIAEDGQEVWCSGVLDHWSEDIIDDIKTMDGFPTTHTVTRAIATSHALLQDAAYKSAVSQYMGVDRDQIAMRYAFVQIDEPYAVEVVELSGEFQEISYIRWRRAIEEWHRRISKGVERMYWENDPAIVTIFPPGWMLNQELELEAMES